MDDKPLPLWQKIAAVVFIVVWGAIILFWHGRASADFWPLDSSRVAPNLVASFILFSLGTIAAALVWPPTRKAMHRFADKKLAPIHEHLAHSRTRQEHIIKQNAHIISSSKSIKNVHADGTDLTDMPEL